MRITYNEVMKLSNVCKDTAVQRLAKLRRLTQKPKHQDITLDDYTQYFGYDYDKALDIIQKP